MELHDGTLYVSSEGEGRGSTFVAELPWLGGAELGDRSTAARLLRRSLNIVHSGAGSSNASDRSSRYSERSLASNDADSDGSLTPGRSFAILKPRPQHARDVHDLTAFSDRNYTGVSDELNTFMFLSFYEEIGL